MAVVAAGAVSMEAEQDLPGFRFHPTEEELLDFYLSRVVHGKKLHFDIIGTLNIYRHDPWDLPGMAKNGEREWYFFVPRDKKAGSGGRPNRTTERGFWKATGSDRAIRSSADAKRVIGLKKTLVFYQGRAPRGTKTDWVMNEYRLPEFGLASTAGGGRAAPKEETVLCKIYRKATPLKELEQRASAMEEMQQRRGAAARPCAFQASDEYLSFEDVYENSGFLLQSSSSSAPSGDDSDGAAPRREAKQEANAVTVASASSSLPQQAVASMMMPAGAQLAFPAAAKHGDLPALQVPANHGVLDWMQDPFQLRSPWQDQFFLSPLAHLLY